MDKQMMTYTRRLSKTKSMTHATEWLWSRIQTSHNIEEVIEAELSNCDKIIVMESVTPKKRDLAVLNREILVGVKLLYDRRIEANRVRTTIPQYMPNDEQKEMRKLLKKQTDKRYYENIMLERTIKELKPFIREYIRRKAIKYQQTTFREDSHSTKSEASADENSDNSDI